MQRLPVSLTIGLLVASASVGWVWAQGRSSAGTLTAQDYVEIQQLYMRYSQGTDFGNAEMWLDVFTNDAIFIPARTTRLSSRRWGVRRSPGGGRTTSPIASPPTTIATGLARLSSHPRPMAAPGDACTGWRSTRPRTHGR